MSLRILHVIRSIHPSSGGPPEIAKHLASALARRGNQAQILAEILPDTLDPIDLAPVKVLSMSASISRHFGLTSQVLKKAIAWADVVHLHGVWCHILLEAGRAARRLDRPYVLAPHGMLDPWSLCQKHWKKRLALHFGRRRLLNSAAILHLGNRDEAKLIAPLGLRPPTAIVPNGIAFEEFEPLPDVAIFRRMHPKLRDFPYILFLSRLHFKKGLDYLADAFIQVSLCNSEVHLVVAGPDEGARSAFEERIRAAQLESRIHLVGPLLGHHKWAALAGATCFCLPSRQEGFSVAILEALACRLPVIISQNCHFPEVAEVGAGEVVSLEPKAIAEALLRVLASPETRRVMGYAGRTLVQERYTWAKVASDCEKVYEQALARHKSGSLR